MSPDLPSLVPVLLAPAIATRKLYERGGFEELEANVLQVLLALSVHESMGVGELADELALGQATVSTALRVLAERGLVQAKRDVADGRRRPQRITSSGLRLVIRFAELADRRLGPDP